MMPSKDTSKNIASFLNTTFGHLFGKNDNADLFKDPIMLTRLVELQNMNSADTSHILHVLDGFIKSVKNWNIAAL